MSRITDIYLCLIRVTFFSGPLKRQKGRGHNCWWRPLLGGAVHWAMSYIMGSYFISFFPANETAKERTEVVRWVHLTVHPEVYIAKVYNLKKCNATADVNKLNPWWWSVHITISGWWWMLCFPPLQVVWFSRRLSGCVLQYLRRHPATNNPL